MVPSIVDSMNDSSVVLVGLIAILIVLWFSIGDKFEGPKADIEKLQG